MKNDKLKKNHFWILCGLVPLLVLIAVVVISSSVGGAIDARNANIVADKKSLDGKSPKPTILVDRLAKLDDEVKKTKTNLWKDNWDRQQNLFTWPNTPKLKAVERAELKFGAPIADVDFTYDQFKNKEVYRAEFSTVGLVGVAPGTVGMADGIAPTQFNGGWERVLRHVNDWGSAVLTSDQIWLVMEDIWVQRSLLSAVKSVNTQLSEFRRVKYEVAGKVIDDPDPKANISDPLRRRFESRTWAVELEVKEKDNKHVLTGRITNLTDRLQLMGVGNTMVLKVWLSEGKDVRPFEFKIGGEFLPGVGSTRVVKVKDKDGKETEQTVPANVMEIVPTDDPTIRETTVLKEIVRVEQSFDARTVPIRRIEAMALGFRDSRHAGSELQLPSFIKEPDPAAADANAGGGTTPPGGGGLGGSAGGPPGGLGGLTPGALGGTGGGATPTQVRGGGSLENVVNANKKRYIALTPDVRRLPVGVVVIVDQAYLQDVLLAFANSPLRFQITQVNWSRFRGTLGGLGTGGGSTGGGSGDDISYSGSGTTGGGDFGGPSLGQPGGKLGGAGGGLMPLPGGGPSFTQPPGGGGSSLGPPGGGGPSFLQPPGGGSSMGPPGGTGFPPGGMGFPGGMGRGNTTTVSESQLTAGLIELQVYGIVSLYEKYSPEAPPEGAPKDPNAKEPNPKDPAGKEPNPKDPAGKEVKGKEPTEKDPKEPDPKDKAPAKEPMGTDPKTSKMRRRTR